LAYSPRTNFENGSLYKPKRDRVAAIVWSLDGKNRASSF
jgi:hypothetical protein